MTDRLTTFGFNFQIKVITSLLTDKSFLQQVSDILSPDYFESDANQWIITSILKYHREYKATPTLEVMKVNLQDVDNDVIKTQIIEHLKDAWRAAGADDLDFIKEKTIEFCKNQEIKKAILDSVTLLKIGKYDDIKLKIDNALKAGGDRDIGHEYMTNIEERYTDAVRNVLPTPWDIINDITDGGVGKGELGVMVASAGAGKSWALVNIGAHAIKAGKTVLHYTLELNQAYVGLRYDSIITGIANQNLKHYQDEVRQQLNKIRGELIIKYFPTKTVSVLGIKSHIEKCILQGKKPDLIIVDYADLLRGHGQEKRHELEGIYEDLRGMAGEYEVPVWTASQANRCHVLTDLVETPAGKIEIGKIKQGDKVLTHKGYRVVTNVFPVEKQGVYKIKMKSGKEITISANHNIPVLNAQCKSISTGLSIGDKIFTKK
jgi:replicative DNA helicase